MYRTENTIRPTPDYYNELSIENYHININRIQTSSPLVESVYSFNIIIYSIYTPLVKSVAGSHIRPVLQRHEDRAYRVLHVPDLTHELFNHGVLNTNILQLNQSMYGIQVWK